MSHALMGLINWWVDNRLSQTPAEMDKLFRGMVRGELVGDEK